MSGTVLSDKDVNAPLVEHQKQQESAKDVKSMEYRQVFQSKMAEEKAAKYVSPSDNIMSPCSAKISALRNKHAAKVNPKSLFAQASAKKLTEENALGARSVQP